MRFAYFGYRKWAEKILHYFNRTSEFNIDSFTVEDGEYVPLKFMRGRMPLKNPKEIEKLDLEEYRALLFYGWSWKIPKEIVNNHECVCLHPSPLPKYRGGSPIQNQIMNGEEKSAVTLFRMGEGLDDGPIYYQKEFSLEGDLKRIFGEIVYYGVDLTKILLSNFEHDCVNTYEQDESQATTYKRRKPSDSELTPGKLENMTARQIHDHIRALQDPYPNAYITGSDGKKVYLDHSKLE